MAGTVEQKLAAEGITLAEPRSPIANYVPFVRSGNLLTVGAAEQEWKVWTAK